MKKRKIKSGKNNIMSFNFNYKKIKINDIQNISSSIIKRINYKKILLFIQDKPFTSFFAILAVFFTLTLIGNIFFATKPSTEQDQSILKKVQVYNMGSAPQVSFQGKVEKSGVVKIIAQMPGIVQYVSVTEGQTIYQGTTILSLATNYQGGNVLSISREMAQTQYQNLKDNYNTQIELINKQKELADKNRDNTDKLRDISGQTLSDTRLLADLNKSIVDSLSANIQGLEQTNVNGANDQLILQAKMQLSQFQSALLQINSSIKNLDFATGSDNPPAQMASISHDLSIKQLELQKKALDMSIELSRLSYNLALVNEANMYPASPFAGTVDRILVHEGESVNPGTVIANISGTVQHPSVVVNVPGDIAKNISIIEPSILEINGEKISVTPDYISKDATSGNLYSVIYNLDDSLSSKLIDESYITVQIPIGVADTGNFNPYIPLDSVVQTQEEAFVYIVDKNLTARAKKITLGQIQGKFVQVLSGLPDNSQIVLNRNVIEGDKVQIVK